MHIARLLLFASAYFSFLFLPLPPLSSLSSLFLSLLPPLSFSYFFLLSLPFSSLFLLFSPLLSPLSPPLTLSFFSSSSTLSLLYHLSPRS